MVDPPKIPRPRRRATFEERVLIVRDFIISMLEIIVAMAIVGFVLKRIAGGHALTGTEEWLLLSAALVIFGRQVVQAVEGRVVGINLAEAKNHKNGDDDRRNP